MLASLYYMSNYSTKDDVKLHQLVMTASIFKSALDKATAAKENLTPKQLSLLKTKPGDYAMKVYHQFRKEKEVGAVSIAAFLIGNPAFYMPNEKSRNLDLFWVKRNVRKYANLSRVDSLDSTDDEAEAFSTFKPTGEDSSSYVDYIYRGPKLVHFCLYEYLSQIGISTRRSAPRGSFSFAAGHPKFDTHRQYSAKLRRPSSDGDGDIDGLWVPAIYGRLTEVNNRGDSADRILEDSQDVQNDIAEALLGLFVPWEQLTPLFAGNASDVTVVKEPRDACARIWGHIEPSLPPYLQRLAINVGYLRRTKEEADKDRLARQIEFDEWEERVFDDPDNIFDSQAEENSLFPEQLSRNDFQHGFLDALDVWARQGSVIGSLGGGRPDFSSYNMLPVPISTVLDGPYMGGNHPAETVQDWEVRMGKYKRGVAAVQEDDGMDDDVAPSSLPEHQLDAITPTLSLLGLSHEDLKTLRSRFLLDQSIKNLMILVGTQYSLNKKQLLTTSMLLKRVMGTPSGEGVGYQTSVSDQFISYIGGTGGTGKTLLIKAFLFGLAILDRLDEVLLTAPTGTAASHSDIGGSTIHAALGVSSFENPRQPTGRGHLDKVRRRLARTKVLVVDEVSMVGSKMLVQVDEKSSRIWSPPAGSSAILGGLPIIQFLGDFKQFEPVRDTPLWKDRGAKATKNEKRASQIWRQVKDVIFLTEQMRQKDDLPYQELLQRAETCSLTQADIDLLNTKTVAALQSAGMRVPDRAIRPINTDRHHYNRSGSERLATGRDQKVWMFAGSHDRPLRSSSQGHISIGSMLSQGDDGTFKGPGIFFYTKGMPVMLLENLLTPFKLVNGRIGKAVDVVVDSDSDVFDLNDRYVLCSRPPACVIVEFDEPTGLTFPGLAPNQHPFFPRKYSSDIKDLTTKRLVKVRRTQVPLTPAFATTDYKAQGASLEELETSLAFSKLKRGSSHYKWTSLNVQLRRLCSFAGLCLREEITMEDVQYKPDEQLLTELRRLETLATSSEGRWRQDLLKDGINGLTETSTVFR
jgi:PIF1-like helicase